MMQRYLQKRIFPKFFGIKKTIKFEADARGVRGESVCREGGGDSTSSPRAKSFLLVFKWATIARRKGMCEVLKNGFPWRITLPRRLRPLFVVLSAVFTPAPDESFRGEEGEEKEEVRRCVSAGEERSSYREQITHLSDRVKTKDRVTDASRSLPGAKSTVFNNDHVTHGVGKSPLRH